MVHPIAGDLLRRHGPVRTDHRTLGGEGSASRIFGDPRLIEAGIDATNLADKALIENLKTITMLSSGFILTSLVWAWALAAAIDRRLVLAGKVMLLAAGMTAFGIIHSPLSGNPSLMSMNKVITSWSGTARWNPAHICRKWLRRCTEE